MAQPGSAPALGAGSRGFKSLCPDQFFQYVMGISEDLENGHYSQLCSR